MPGWGRGAGPARPPGTAGPGGRASTTEPGALSDPMAGRPRHRSSLAASLCWPWGHRFQGPGPAQGLQQQRGGDWGGCSRTGWVVPTDGCSTHPPLAGPCQGGQALLWGKTCLCLGAPRLSPSATPPHSTARHGHHRALQSRDAASHTPVFQEELRRPGISEVRGWSRGHSWGQAPVLRRESQRGRGREGVGSAQPGGPQAPGTR